MSGDRGDVVVWTREYWERRRVQWLDELRTNANGMAYLAGWCVKICEQEIADIDMKDAPKPHRLHLVPAILAYCLELLSSWRWVWVVLGLMTFAAGGAILVSCGCQERWDWALTGWGLFVVLAGGVMATKGGTR
jgi:hypothetical protein